MNLNFRYLLLLIVVCKPVIKKPGTNPAVDYYIVRSVEKQYIPRNDQ